MSKQEPTVEVTLKQLDEIEWASSCNYGDDNCCPVCGETQSPHQKDCWLGNALIKLRG